MNILPSWAQAVAREMAERMPPPEGEHLEIGGSSVEWVSGEIHAAPDTGEALTILVGRVRLGQRGSDGDAQQVWTHQTITCPGTSLSMRTLCMLRMIALAVWASEAERPGSMVSGDLLRDPPYVAPGVFAEACRIALKSLTQDVIEDAIGAHRAGVAIAEAKPDPLFLVLQALRPAVKHALMETLDVDLVVTSLLLGWLDDRPRPPLSS